MVRLASSDRYYVSRVLFNRKTFLVRNSENEPQTRLEIHVISYLDPYLIQVTGMDTYCTYNMYLPTYDFTCLVPCWFAMVRIFRVFCFSSPCLSHMSHLPYLPSFPLHPAHVAMGRSSCHVHARLSLSRCATPLS